MVEAHSHARVPQEGELLGSPPPGHRQVVGARPQILANCHDVHTDGPQISQGGQYLVLPLSHAENHPRLGGEARILGPCQQGQASCIARRWTDRSLQTSHSLDVVVHDVRAHIEDGPQRAFATLAVRDQYLNGRPRAAPTYRLDGFGKPSGSTIVQIIPRYTGDHRMSQAHPSHGFTYPLGLIGIEGQGVTGIYLTEPTRSGAP